MVEAGDMFKTGEKVTTSGIYSYVRHTESMTPFTCSPTPEEERLKLSEGDTFPAHSECKQGVIWKLVKRT